MENLTTEQIESVCRQLVKNRQILNSKSELTFRQTKRLCEYTLIEMKICANHPQIWQKHFTAKTKQL